jgi:thiamine biosynthesis lipoprotein
MGSPFNLIFYHHDSSEATEIAKKCFAIVDSLNNIFSDYSSTSEISMLSENAYLKPHHVSDNFLYILMESKIAWIKSGKVFDITIGTLTSLWRKARKEKRFPSKSEIKKAKRLTGFKNLQADTVNNTFYFSRKGLRLDFGGIVKGYAAQKVINYLSGKNITHALADAGGDIVMSEPPPGKTGWTIGVNMPQQENQLWNQNLLLANCSVATSGDLYQFVSHKGKKYSHIIDPRSGYGVTSQRNVTVIAKDGTTADWLATACSILPIRKALGLAEKENAALLITILKDEKIVIHKTGNFDSFLQKKEP